MQIFCLGTFLAVTAQIIVARYEDSIVSQLFVSFAGLAIMSLAAYAASWFKAESRGRPSHEPAGRFAASFGRDCLVVRRCGG